MKWSLKTLKIKDIYPNEKNPKTIFKRQAKGLETSIKRFGLCQPIVINIGGKILGGHKRFELMHSLGFDTVDVYVPNKALTIKQEEALSLSLNRNIRMFDYDRLDDCWGCEEILHVGFTPNQSENTTSFIIKIICANQEQLEEMEEYIAPMVNAYEGAIYRVKVK